jgi:transposase
MRDGRASHCRRCNNAAVREWRERHADYVAAYNAKRRAEYAKTAAPR